MADSRKLKKNFLDACVIIAGTIPQSLREYLRISWKRIYLCEWGFPSLEFSGNQYWNGDSSNIPVIGPEDSKNVKEYVKRQKDGLKEKLLSGDTCKWDQTLLSKILEYSSHGFTDSRAKEAISKLRYLRNEYYGHTHSASTTDSVLADLKQRVASFCSGNGLVESLAELQKIDSEQESLELAWSCLIRIDQQLEVECSEQVFSLACTDAIPSCSPAQASFRLIRSTLRAIIECCSYPVSRPLRIDDSPSINLDHPGSPPQQINSQSLSPSAASSATDSSHHLIVDDFPEVSEKGIGRALADLLCSISKDMSTLSCCTDDVEHKLHNHHLSNVMELNETAVAMHFSGTSCQLLIQSCCMMW